MPLIFPRCAAAILFGSAVAGCVVVAPAPLPAYPVDAYDPGAQAVGSAALLGAGAGAALGAITGGGRGAAIGAAAGGAIGALGAAAAARPAPYPYAPAPYDYPD